MRDGVALAYCQYDKYYSEPARKDQVLPVSGEYRRERNPAKLLYRAGPHPFPRGFGNASLG